MTVHTHTHTNNNDDNNDNNDNSNNHHTSLKQMDHFRHHCKIYYQKSLSIISTSSSLTSISSSTSYDNDNDNNKINSNNDNDIENQEHYKEEKRIIHNNDNNNNNNDNNAKNNDDIQISKMVLDAFELQLSYNESKSNNNNNNIISSKEYNDFLNYVNQHPSYIHVLQSCGLYDDDNGYDNNNNNDEKIMMYMKIMNEERRIAHLLQMKNRNDIFHQLLNNNNDTIMKTYQSQKDSTQKERRYNHYYYLGEHNVTTQKYLSHVRMTLKQFVYKYKHNIGTHSFLGGLRTIIQKQSNEERSNVIWYWKFNSMIISEACFSSGDYEHVKEENGVTYMKDAISVLLSFMIHSPNIMCDDEEEVVVVDEHIDLVQFYIHPCISNAFLRRIMIEIPSSLDAKPTGKFYTSESDSSTKSNLVVNSDNDVEGGVETTRMIRTNIGGEQDESFYHSLQEWTNSLCDIL